MKVIEINENEFEEKIKSGKKVLVDCYADWCMPCKMLSPIIDELAEDTEDCTFFKINVDDAPEVANKYDIMSIPTLLFFVDGELKEQMVGLKSREEIEDMIG